MFGRLTAVAAGAAAVALVLPGHAAATAVPTNPATPALQGPIPRTATSVPIGTAQLPGAAESVDLARNGYVENEYFVSGNANIYGYDASGQNLEVKTPDVPYTTVILVAGPRTRGASAARSSTR